MAFLILEEFEKAIELAKRLSGTRGNTTAALVFQSLAYLGLSNLDAAMNALTRIWLISRETDMKASMGIGHIFLMQQDEDNALIWYRKSRALYTNDELFFNDIWDDHHFLNMSNKGVSSLMLELLLKRLDEE